MNLKHVAMVVQASRDTDVYIEKAIDKHLKKNQFKELGRKDGGSSFKGDFLELLKVGINTKKENLDVLQPLFEQVFVKLYVEGAEDAVRNPKDKTVEESLTEYLETIKQEWND